MHTCWGWTQIACGYSTLMTVLLLVVQNHANTLNMDTNAINALVANACLCTASFASMLHMWAQFDHILHDILPEEEGLPIQFTPAKHPRIDQLSARCCRAGPTTLVSH